jgi:hypothetical protein
MRRRQERVRAAQVSRAVGTASYVHNVRRHPRSRSGCPDPVGGRLQASSVPVARMQRNEPGPVAQEFHALHVQRPPLISDGLCERRCASAFRPCRNSNLGALRSSLASGRRDLRRGGLHGVGARLRHSHGAHRERQSQNNCQIAHGKTSTSATMVHSETRCAGWQMVSQRAAGAICGGRNGGKRPGEAPPARGSPVLLSE